MHQKVKGLFIILLLVYLLTGCWDLVEINQRAFIIGIGLDSLDGQIQSTYVYPNLPILTGQGGGDEANFIKKTVGTTPLETNKNFNKISNLKLSFEHAKLIVFGNDFIQDEDKMRKVLDFFDRNPDFSLSLIVIATDSTADALLTAKPNASEPIGIFIDEMFKGAKAEELADYRYSLLDMITSLIETDGTTVMPIVNSKEGEIKVDGMVVLKNYVKVGRLSLEQMIPFNWLLGRGRGLYTVKKVSFKDATVSYEISQIKRKVDIVEKNGSLDIHITIQTEGDLKDYVLLESSNLFNNENVKKIEEELKEGMEENANEIIRVAQAEIGVDIFNLASELKKSNGKLWESVKDEWEYYFNSANITVEIIPSVRRIGMAK